MTRGQSRIRAVLACGAIALLSACGGGGGGSAASGPIALPPVNATPTPGPVANAPFSVTGSTAVSFAGASVAIALPSAAGFGGSLSLPPPAAATSTTLTQTLTNQAPAGLPALGAGRLPQAFRAVRDVRHTAIVYVRLMADRVVQMPGSPAFTLSLPASSLIPGATYYVALLQQGWNLGWQGPAAVDGTTLTFPAGAAAFAFQPNTEYWFALVAFAPGSGPPSPQPSPVATPTPAATASPTPVPGSTPSPPPGPAETPSPAPPTATPTTTPAPPPGATPTPAPPPGATPTPSPPPAATPTPAPPPRVTPTPTPPPGATPTPAPRPTATPTAVATPSPTPSGTSNPTPLPSPTPVPTPVGTPPPSPLTISSASQYFAATPAPVLMFTSTGQSAGIAVGEAGYTGPFGAVVTAIQPGSGCTLPEITVSPGQGASFTVSSGTSAGNPPYCGTATIAFSDPRPGGATAQLTVQLTASSVGFAARRRR